MKKKIIAGMLAVAGLSGSATAAQIIGGTGLGFNANPVVMVGKIIFNKKDLKADAPAAVIKSGNNVGAPAQGADGNIIVPPTKSMAWCDPATKGTPAGDFSACYGWAMHSKWVLLDLNTLKDQGLSSVWVTITASRVADGTATGDLIPAVTVFQGNQNEGAQLHWYPNRFQAASPFPLLKPFNSGNPGWDTAYDNGDQSTATVTGKLTLKGGKNARNNFLTVAVGGDERNAAQKHDVNFQLAVKLSKTRPTSPVSGPTHGSIDKYGCSVGTNCWHPQMGHCMAIPACDEPQYAGQCLCTK